MSRQARRVGEAVLLEGVGVPYVEAGVPAAVWLGAPLISKGNVVGVIALEKREPTLVIEHREVGQAVAIEVENHGRGAPLREHRLANQ